MIYSKQIVRTTECQRQRHPEFRLSFDSTQVVDPDVMWLLGFLTKNVASGIQYKPDQLFQIGWMILKVHSNEEGTLSLFEPDFEDLPIRFIDSVTQTLVHLRLQKSVLESVAMEDSVTFPSLLQSALTCTRSKDRADFLMERFESSANDSGWYLGCLDNDHDHNDPTNLKRLSLYELACGRPACVPFVALPPQSVVEAKANDFGLRFKGQSLVARENSFLKRYSQTLANLKSRVKRQ